MTRNDHVHPIIRDIVNAASAQVPAVPTPGPWDYVPGNENHGPYVTSAYGSTICDCYMMTNPADWSVANGGTSKPVPFMAEMADPNARLIAAAPELLDVARLLIAWEDETHDTSPAGQHERAVKAARAAIAKVEGRS